MVITGKKIYAPHDSISKASNVADVVNTNMTMWSVSYWRIRRKTGGILIVKIQFLKCYLSRIIRNRNFMLLIYASKSLKCFFVSVVGLVSPFIFCQNSNRVITNSRNNHIVPTFLFSFTKINRYIHIYIPKIREQYIIHVFIFYFLFLGRCNEVSNKCCDSSLNCHLSLVSSCLIFQWS